MIVIHPTTLGRLDCSLQYLFSRNYRPLTVSDYYEFGLAVHHALDLYYGEGIDPVKAFKEYMKEHTILLGDDKSYDLGIAMLNNYKNQYGEADEKRFRVIATEFEIARRVPIPADEPNPPRRAKQFYVAARVDGLVHDKILGENFALEHKTFSRFYPAHLSRDHQFIIEKYVADGWSKKVPVAGVIYNGLRKSAKPGKTTKLFERHTLYIDDVSVEVMLHRVYWELKKISSDDFHAYPEPNLMKCNYCDFKQPCDEYMHGGDYEFVLENLFQKREEDENEWSST